MDKNSQTIYEINEFGNKYWFFNNKLHRLDGPAAEYSNGDKLWFLYGRYHREDGPAIENANRTKEWWYQGQRIDCSSQGEFERLIKLKALW